MTLIDEIHQMAWGAADLLNNTSEKISPDYKLGYAQGILDAIVEVTKPDIKEDEVKR